MTFYWELRVTQDYIEQMGNLSIVEQVQISKHWLDFVTSENPMSRGSTSHCMEGKPYTLIIFQGLPFEFIYQMDQDKKEILLISCERFEFLDHGQPDIL